jgi:hypothetical protein
VCSRTSVAAVRVALRRITASATRPPRACDTADELHDEALFTGQAAALGAEELVDTGIGELLGHVDEPRSSHRHR